MLGGRGDWMTQVDEKSHSRELAKRRRAVERAVRKHDRLLVNWLAQKIGDADTAKDIAQNAYLRVLNYAEKNDIENARALIFKTAANLAANEFRNRRRAQFLTAASFGATQDVIDAVACDAPSAERTAVAKQDLEASMSAINGLPARVRRAFILSRFMGLKYCEIAKDLNVSESSVEKYIISALKALRSAVDQENARNNVVDMGNHRPVVNREKHADE